MRPALILAAAAAAGGLVLIYTQAQASVQPEQSSAPVDAWTAYYNAYNSIGADTGSQVDQAAAVDATPDAPGTGAVEPGFALDFSFLSDPGADMNAAQNVAAFLLTIRACEGTSGANGYRYLFGSTPAHEKLFDSFNDHPRVKTQFTQTDGSVNYTTAAGAYQFLASTWDGLARKLGLADFSPASQDRAAQQLVADAHALADVEAGRFDAAIGKCSRIWASLPGSPYPQATRSAQFTRLAYESAGGAYA